MSSDAQLIQKKKEFALAAIAPYYKDPTICGSNSYDSCCYLTDDGRKCVFGKFLVRPEDFKTSGETAEYILQNHGEGVLVEEARDILTPKEWYFLQQIHDAIAKKFRHSMIEAHIELLGLFTVEELIVAVSKLSTNETKTDKTTVNTSVLV